MSLWRLIPLQPQPFDRSGHVRFDATMIDAIAERLEHYDHDVLIEHAVPDPNGVLTVHGAEFSGMFGDGLILEETDTGRFWVVDMQDCDNGPGRMLAESPNWCGSALTFYHRPTIKKNYGPLYERTTPGQSTALYPTMITQHTEQVSELREGPLDPRLFFAGTLEGAPGNPYVVDKGTSIRAAVIILGEKYPDETRIEATKTPREFWILEAARHTMCLAHPGHPWCSREYELFSVGIPVLAYAWESEIRKPWLVNTHYTAIEDLPLHRLGFPLDPERGADAIIKRFRQVRDKPTLLAERAQHAWLHYRTYFTPERHGQSVADWVTSAAEVLHAST